MRVVKPGIAIAVRRERTVILFRGTFFLISPNRRIDRFRRTRLEHHPIAVDLSNSRMVSRTGVAHRARIAGSIQCVPPIREYLFAVVVKHEN